MSFQSCCIVRIFLGIWSIYNLFSVQKINLLVQANENYNLLAQKPFFQLFTCRASGLVLMLVPDTFEIFSPKFARRHSDISKVFKG